MKKKTKARILTRILGRTFLVLLTFLVIAVAGVICWNSQNKIMRSILILIISSIFIGNCHRVYLPMVTDQSFKNNVYVQIGEFLIQEGYENGYTNFDHANAMTVANDGRIQISAVDSVGNMEICKWLTSKKWFVPNVPMESKTAYIISDQRMEEFAPFLQEHSDTVELKEKIGGFNIYGSAYNYSKLTD